MRPRSEKLGRGIYFKATEEDDDILAELMAYWGENQTGALRAGLRALKREKEWLEEARRRGLVSGSRGAT